MKMTEYNRADLIFCEGEQGACMYDIREGKVGIFARYGEEGEKKLTELSEGAFFGEMGMVEKAPRSASAVALADHTVVCEIAEDDLAALFAQEPEKVLAILQHMSRRLRGLTADYLKACETAANLADAGAGELPDELRERVARYARVAEA